MTCQSWGVDGRRLRVQVSSKYPVPIPDGHVHACIELLSPKYSGLVAGGSVPWLCCPVAGAQGTRLGLQASLHLCNK